MWNFKKSQYPYCETYFRHHYNFEQRRTYRSVSKMLGHKKMQTTQHYARVLDIKVSEDMEAFKETHNL